MIKIDYIFADVVRGEAGNLISSNLKGWRCRNCGSWDFFAVVVVEKNGSNKAGPKQKVQGKLNYGSKGVGQLYSGAH